jgi:hypothetical protein
LNICGAHAEEHTYKALEHAKEAADSTDSKSVIEHTSEALKHIDKAKLSNPRAIQHYKNAEDALRDAERNARWHNTDSAAGHADEGKKHLEEAVGGAKK